MAAVHWDRDDPRRISWDQLDLDPILQLKFGITRRTYRLARQPSDTRVHVEFQNELVRLQGRWENVNGFGSRLSFRLTNIGSESVRLTRLVFRIAGGLDSYFSASDPNDLSFFRNGYQSWSTARSYRRQDKPLRPWLQIVSLASSNLANLPSNVPGVLSSEMYTVITDRRTGECFLVGQGAPFDQFFYIRLNLYSRIGKESYFELTYDFGRQMVLPNDSVELGSIYFAKGPTHETVHRYFLELREKAHPRVPRRPIHGWCSWYYYYTKISPEVIRRNIDALKRARDQHGAHLELVQIDDGYQLAVGDWLSLTPQFEGQMGRLADEIRAAGFTPGLWLAPFVASARSELLAIHPEYALRDENGRRIVAGYNFTWPGHYYYGLDITNPRFEEYLRRVIRTIVGEWGFRYLKCDFLFAGCLRGGTHHDLELSRAEVLRHGMRVIREEAEDNTQQEVVLVGCGMPLVSGIGEVDVMRVGPDTGHFWVKRVMRLLRTGAMVGVRNSIRNSMVRGVMHRALWTNDPDCILLRTEGTHLSEEQRRTQINAVALTGGALLYSDDFGALRNDQIAEIEVLQQVAEDCFGGRLIPFDMMDCELPGIVLNTAGYLGVFNMEKKTRTVKFNIDRLLATAAVVAESWGGKWRHPEAAHDVWTGERRPLDTSTMAVGPLAGFSSRLFRLE